MIITKICTQCKKEQVRAEFGTKKNGKPNSWCKSCVRKRSSEYYKRLNPNAKTMAENELPYGKRDDPAYMKRYNWITKYKLTDDRIEEILSIQNNKCPICLSQFSDTNQFHVDHDHYCCPGRISCGNCVRGFLCNTCNSSLGKLQDNVEALQRAINYLEGNPFYDRRRS